MRHPQTDGPNEIESGRDGRKPHQGKITTMKTFARIGYSARKLLQRGGPYLLLEIVLPGGSLIALLLFVYRNWTRFGTQPALN